ncbi:MAG: hypothetical protein J5828_06530 [Desulfovibrionaceae bacterium]|nr:hypothetical protein [Desulfovibrionaceae bacterium]
MYFFEKSKMAGGAALVEKLGWSLYSQGVCAGMTVWKKIFFQLSKSETVAAYALPVRQVRPACCLFG